MAGDRPHGTGVTPTPTPTSRPAPPPAPAASPAAVVVTIDATRDHTRQLPHDEAAHLTALVEARVAGTGYATSWPGAPPTARELEASRARAFRVAPTVTRVEITRAGDRTQIACSVDVRVSPWLGADRGEHWQPETSARASGSAQATSDGPGREQIDHGIRACARGVLEEVTARHVLPFLDRVARRS
ncbi:MAG TPA: hypothetical protein VM734_16500 [Kofleriaceae bacterium]|nr:hypothetical protein [Kofleriaceae bacterium]